MSRMTASPDAFMPVATSGYIRAFGAGRAEADYQDWIAGKDFEFRISPLGWLGGRYFSKNDRYQLAGIASGIIFCDRHGNEAFRVPLPVRDDE